MAAADAAQVARGSGLTGTGAWLAKHTRTTGVTAAREVALASALDQLPATERALSTGEVSTEHAAVIAAATRQLPTDLRPDQRETIEQSLVEHARHLDPAALRTRARRALDAVATAREADAHHDAVLRDEERRARERTRFTLRDNGDGTSSGAFTVPTLAAAILRKAIQQIASPRRARLGARLTQGGSAGPVDWQQRHGQAFAEILEHLPTDHLHHKVAATIVVTLDHDQLTHDLAAAGVDTGHEISAGEARRLACGAGLLPAVLDGNSLPLDLGRTQRFFTQAQAVALATRHTSCAAQGCDRPYAWCELHHRQPWSRGGTTNLRDAIPLCSFHHQRVHDPGYVHREHPDGTLTFHLVAQPSRPPASPMRR